MGEIVNGIEAQLLTIKALTLAYDVSDRTISNKIKQSGYRWGAKEAKYTYVGDNFERDSNKVFEEMFTKPVPVFKGYAEINNASDPEHDKVIEIPVDKETEELLTPVVTPATKKKEVQTPAKPSKSVPQSSKATSKVSPELDRIDFLLGKVEKKEKTYRGFYIDNDVIAVLDEVASGNKSELVNECLIAVFKQKGLM